MEGNFEHGSLPASGSCESRLYGSIDAASGKSLYNGMETGLCNFPEGWGTYCLNSTIIS
ncbi:hypothetical protein [Methanosarcina sp. WWM596]|uniref:hypothetical protein n=1 Tax=Methanosarcina sp. WWM596 TaxID=1434103 RepID=UPI0018CF725E|nr:hypothetical protein [Methanosarcina sp. WWM596]